MALPKDIHAESLSRLPLLERSDLDEQGKRLYDAVVGPQSRTLVGNYAMTAVILNTFDQQLRPDQKPLLPSARAGAAATRTPSLPRRTRGASRTRPRRTRS